MGRMDGTVGDIGCLAAVALSLSPFIGRVLVVGVFHEPETKVRANNATRQTIR
jgi:hypothetical protein